MRGKWQWQCAACGPVDMGFAITGLAGVRASRISTYGLVVFQLLLFQVQVQFFHIWMHEHLRMSTT